MTRLNPEELLAAYADGGLNHTEREAVEAYLEDNPGARSELDGIRSMLTRVRENPPEPASEPSWAAMSVAINEATGQTTGETTGEAEAAPAGFAARLQAWFDGLSRPRLVMGGLAMAAAAVILFALATGWPGADDNGDGRGPGVAQDDMRAPLVDEVDEVDEADELERALDEALDDALARDEDAPGENPHTDTELPEIDDDEVVDALFEALDPEVIALEAEAELEAISNGDALPETLLAEWAGPEESPGGSLDESERDLESVDPARYDGWLDDLSDQELEQLDAMLGEMMTG